jgi:hypothetical protein
MREILPFELDGNPFKQPLEPVQVLLADRATRVSVRHSKFPFYLHILHDDQLDCFLESLPDRF